MNKSYLLLGTDQGRTTIKHLLERGQDPVFGSEARGVIECQARDKTPISELAGRVIWDANGDTDVEAFSRGWEETLRIRVKHEHQLARVPRYTRTRKEAA